MTSKKRKCILISGMHRSGTSAMAGLLHKKGLELGDDLMVSNSYNEKGYFEHNKIYKLNDELLDYLGSRWDQSFLLPNGWERKNLEVYREKLVEILGEFEKVSTFVIKDPRVSVLLPFYQSVFDSLGIQDHYLIMVRHPEEIFNSLQEREGFKRDKCFLLWFDYLMKAELYTRSRSRLFVSFNSLLQEPLVTLKSVLDEFKIEDEIAEGNSDLAQFVERRLKHFEIRSDLSNSGYGEYAILYDFLNKLTINPRLGIDDEQVLDQLRIGYQSNLQKYGAVLMETSEERHRAIEDEMEGKRRSLEQKLHYLETESQSIKSEFEQLSNQFKETIQLLESKQEQCTSTQIQLEETKKRLDDEILKYSEVLAKLEKEKLNVQSLQTHLDKSEKAKERLEERLIQNQKKYERTNKGLLTQIEELDNRLLVEARKFKDQKSQLDLQSQLIHDLEHSVALSRAQSEDLQNSFTYRFGGLLTYPFRWIYNRFASDKRFDETRIWLFGSLIIAGFSRPISVLKYFNVRRLKTLIKAISSEKNGEIVQNFRKLLKETPAGNQDNNRIDDLRFLNPQINSSPSRLQILYISPNLPDFDSSSGGRRATEMLDLLARDFDVYCFTTGERPQKYVEKLRSLGVYIIDTNDPLQVKNYCDHLDVIIFAWYYTFYNCAAIRDLFPQAWTIADTVDVHWIREERSIGEFEKLTEERVKSNKQKEIHVYRSVDVIWTVTEPDSEAIRREIPNARIKVVSNIHNLEILHYQKKTAPNILFFGGFQHYPNIKAVTTLANRIFPIIRQEVPEAKLLIAGSKAPESVVGLGRNDGVEFLGFVEEEDVQKLYERTALTIIPLFSGAGIKGKICQAISFRVPVITNSIGNEGINLVHRIDGFVTEDENEMAEIAIEIFKSKTMDLEALTKRAQEKIKQLVGKETALESMVSSFLPTVSICIVTWNRLQLLKNCIESILRYTKFPNYKIIVYSNACTDGTREYLESLSKDDSVEVIPIFSDQNEVFVIPNNKMMKMFPGDDIVLLNNDTEVTEGWLLNLYRAAYAADSIGISGSKVLYPDGRLQEFGSELFATGTGRNIGKNDDPEKSDYQGIKRVGYVSGCSMYIKRETLNRIGYFDEEFHPCYCEDSDLCYTGWENGIETVVTSASVIYHHEGATSGTDTSEGFKSYQEVNMKKFLKKHKKYLSSLNGKNENTGKVQEDMNLLIHPKEIRNIQMEEDKMWVPAGHFYSPIPSKEEVTKQKDKIYKYPPHFEGLDMNIENQLSILDSISEFGKAVPFPEEKNSAYRYYFKNNYFSFGDAITLYCMIRLNEPSKIIEIGSGYSSAVMLDTNEQYFGNEIKLRFIEPYPDRLKGLLKASDNVEIIEKKIQDVDLVQFGELKAGDILFIDSTHVSKVGSDVNQIFFNILPVLNKGVLIHIHDISANFELPYNWVMEGRSWNECYLLRSFLMYNSSYSIQFFNSYLGMHFKELIGEKMPLFVQNTGGSIWLRKEK